MNLTPLQVAILQLVAEGRSNKEIGEQFHYSPAYVEQKLGEIYRAMNLPRNIRNGNLRARAVYEAMKRGIIK